MEGDEETRGDRTDTGNVNKRQRLDYRQAIMKNAHDAHSNGPNLGRPFSAETGRRKKPYKAIMVSDRDQYGERSVYHLHNGGNERLVRKLSIRGSDYKLGVSWAQFEGYHDQDLITLMRFMKDYFGFVEHDKFNKVTYFTFEDVETAETVYNRAYIIAGKKVEFFKTVKYDKEVTVINIPNFVGIKPKTLVTSIMKELAEYGDILDATGYFVKGTNMMVPNRLKILFAKKENVEIPRTILVEDEAIAIFWRGCDPMCTFCNEKGHWRNVCEKMEKRQVEQIRLRNERKKERQSIKERKKMIKERANEPEQTPEREQGTTQLESEEHQEDMEQEQTRPMSEEEIGQQAEGRYQGPAVRGVMVPATQGEAMKQQQQPQEEGGDNQNSDSFNISSKVFRVTKNNKAIVTVEESIDFEQRTNKSVLETMTNKGHRHTSKTSRVMPSIAVDPKHIEKTKKDAKNRAEKIANKMDYATTALAQPESRSESRNEEETMDTDIYTYTGVRKPRIRPQQEQEQNQMQNQQEAPHGQAEDSGTGKLPDQDNSNQVGHSIQDAEMEEDPPSSPINVMD